MEQDYIITAHVTTALSCRGCAAFILGLVLPHHSLTWDFILGGAAFTIVGGGVVLSLIIANPQWKEKKTQLLSGGIISGFIAGLFFHFGIGLYFGIIIFSVCIYLLLKVLRIFEAPRIFLGGVIGSVIGCILSSLFQLGWSHIELSYPIFRGQLSIVTTTINTAIIIYFLNLGILLSIGGSTDERGRNSHEKL